MAIRGKTYTLGVLVQSNFGAMKDLTISGDHIGRRIAAKLNGEKEGDRGSVMIILATDLPVDSRQLKRILKRCETGLVRLGSRLGHGSGDVVIGFTTANAMGNKEGIISHEVLPEHLLEQPFRMAGEAVEEAVLDSMVNAEAMKDLEGRTVHSLREFL
jgi:D-aminopeptidase